MDLKIIQYIQEIVRCGSMTKAADKLYVSQSALSQYVKRVESALGMTMFVKEGSHLRLTPQGEIFIREGDVVLKAYDNMCNHIRQLNEPTDDPVSIGISEFYGRFFLPKLFPAMKEEFPDIQLRLVQETSTVLLDLAREGILDFCITPFSEKNEGLSFEYLCTEEILLAVPAGCPALTMAIPGSDFPSIDLQHFRDYPFIMMRKDQLISPITYNLCTSAGFTPQVACEVMGWQSIDRLIAANVGVGFLPYEMALTVKATEGVTFCHIISPISTTRAIMVGMAKDKPLSVSAQNTVKVLREVACSSIFTR